MELKDKERCEAIYRELERYKKKYDLLYQWMKLKQNKVNLAEFFYDRKIKSVAIYGMGDLGQMIYNESGIREIVKYGIDKQVTAEQGGLPIYPLEKAKQKVDAILITPVLITDMIEDQIYAVLGEQTTFVFEEVLFELSRKHGMTFDLWPI